MSVSLVLNFVLSGPEKLGAHSSVAPTMHLKYHQREHETV